MNIAVVVKTNLLVHLSPLHKVGAVKPSTALDTWHDTWLTHAKICAHVQ